MEYDMNPMDSTTINFAFLDQVSVARIVLPSDSIELDDE